MKNKTVLLIAHRMRTVAGADQIIVLKNGHVAENGSPETLMEENGIFCHMSRLQTEAAKLEHPVIPTATQVISVLTSATPSGAAPNLQMVAKSLRPFLRETSFDFQA